MLGDARAAVLITTSIYDLRFTIDDLDDSDDAIVNRKSKIVNLAADWPSMAQAAPTPPATGVTADSLAYVIYTSGSTGTPKGAMISNAAIVNRLRWMQATYALDARDVVLQKTPFSFDVSVWEFFWPLMSGARLVLARPGGHQDSGYIAELIGSQKISTLHFVPTMLHVFLDEPELERCDCLRRVICSGEALPVELQTRYFSRLRAPLYNLYGPTEAAVDVTAWQCRPDAGQLNVAIGRPIANTQIYLVGRELELVPLGVAGELYIGGVQLARGYLNRPDLTAEKFIPNPFVDAGDKETRRQGDKETLQSAIGYRLSAIGYRLYATGDRARYRADGTIEYLGRLDGQVKLRGVRIEVGEIEAVLGQHPAVREAVVVAREDVPGQLRLVTYVVPNEDRHRGTIYRAPTPDNAEHDPSIVHRPSSIVQALRDHLKARLPASMIPAAFVLLDSLPVTPNGKLDRRALPAPADGRPELATAFVAPRTPIEQMLAGIWCHVLGIAEVGIPCWRRRCSRAFDLPWTSSCRSRACSMRRRWLGSPSASSWHSGPRSRFRCRRYDRLREMGRCRFRSVSSGCGFSTSCSRIVPRIICPAPAASAGRSIWRCSTAASIRSCAVTRRCAPALRWSMAAPCRSSRQRCAFR
jgi:amino acid adenylation domain-containing protein